MSLANSLSLVFFGTPDFAAFQLDALIKKGYPVKAVVTAPDKPAGRGMLMQASPVKKVAQQASIPILQPEKLKDESFLLSLKELQADLFIVVAFRMLPGQVFEIPPSGTINLHASLLPNLRGAAPIQWSIAYGLKETGLTTFFIEKEIDTGKIIRRAVTPIHTNETGGSLYNRLMRMGPALMEETLSAIANNESGYPQKEARFQPEGLLLAAPKFNTENTRINFSLSYTQIDQFCRAMDPFPGAWCMMQKGDEEVAVKIFSIASCMALDEELPLKTACSEGFFVPLEMQEAGKKRMNAKDWYNGYGKKSLQFFLK